MEFIKNILLISCSNVISFILLYKYVFLTYIFNIILTLYLTKHLLFHERFSLVFKSCLFIFSVQMVKLLASSL